MDRRPAVAGFFYPRDPNALRKLLDELFLEHPLGPKRKPEGDNSTIALLCPHAGYVYSGPCAAHGYVHIPKVDTIVIAGPNHTGLGAPISVRPEGRWITPIGSLEVDAEFVELLTSYGPASKDELAHLEEHSVEVQLPFIIYAYENLNRDLPQIVPIVLGYQGADAMILLASKILEVAEKLGKRVAFIASSDLNHYEPHSVTVAKDLAVLRCVESLDIDCLYRTIFELEVSVCGYGAIAIAIELTRRLNGKAKTLSHITSGDVTGELDAVVGYASVHFYR